MFGLCNIPCVSVLVDKVSEYTVNALFRGLRYMFCYQSLVDDLNSQIEKLNIEEGNMLRKVSQEKANGKEILDHVSRWQTEAEKIQKPGKELSPSCSCIQRLPVPNPISRFRIGRNAVKKAETVRELTNSGKEHLSGDIAYLPQVIYMPNPETTFEEFKSREDAYKKLWDSLVDEDSPLIHGIHGMAGVGKTRMMEQLWEESLNKKIFNKAVRVDVGSESTDKIILQQQIASLLDCKLETQDVKRRASQLENSLRNGNKILFILDDVWRDIHLDDIIGTPFGNGSSSSGGSKILFTSRKSEVCLVNKCKFLVEIETLSPDEALYLFEKTVGRDSINSLPDQSLVKKVCDKCGQLPLLIHALGKALKGKSYTLWKNAHDLLQEGKFEEIVDVDPQVYTGIKLSIDYLQNNDAKTCLFLCSMFPEDANIDMKLLIHLATGSQLIHNGETGVLAVVDYLKASSLLLVSGKDNETKIHDTIRAVARSIASTDLKYAFLQLNCKSRNLPVPPFNASYHTRRLLHLDAKTHDVRFDEHLVCPDLHTLWLQSNHYRQQISGGFFSMFANLSFLMLQKVDFSLEQFSLQPLGNLRTLTLLDCEISKTDVSPFPESLKTLCICDCVFPMPLDIANLKNLRKLEIQHWRPKLVMVSNFLSSLSKLEELHIPYGFISDHEEYHTEARVMEMRELTSLTSLQFQFYDDNSFQGTDIFDDIERYKILVGEVERFNRPELAQERALRVPSTRSIELYDSQSQPWAGLLARAEEVRLSFSDLNVSSICSGYRRAFEDLERLYIRDCEIMGHLASISQDEIFSLNQRATCFSKLTILQVSFCPALKYLFCNNFVKCLVQLQELSVRNCGSMEAIIMNEGTSDGDIINFRHLKSLTLSGLSTLTNFYVEKKNMERALSTDHSAQYQPLFDGMVAFPSLKVLDVEDLPNTSVIWGNDCCDDTVSSFCKLTHLTVRSSDKLEIVIPQAMLHRLNHLEHIKVYGCRSLRAMFPPSVASDLTHLKEIRVSNCKEMREIIEAGEQIITDGILFPELTVLDLYKLTSLTRFWCYKNETTNTFKVSIRLPRLSSIVLVYVPDLKSLFHGESFEFHTPALKKVDVCKCGLPTLFTFTMFRNFQLEGLAVRDCEPLENIVEDLKGNETCDKIITLSQLEIINLAYLPNLKSFFQNSNYEFHMPALKELIVRKCGFSNTLFKCSVFRKLKQLKRLVVDNSRLLQDIFEDAGDDEASDTSDRIIALSQLSNIVLEDLPNLRSCFYSANYECSMPALKEVTVRNCGLSAIFTCTVFRQLQQLENLVVNGCRLLEHIVKNVGDDETSEADDKDITMYQLSKIELDDLPILKSFGCTGSYVFNMPKLHMFWMLFCPRLEYFTSLETRAPLVGVYGGPYNEQRVPDLNEFFRQNYKRGSYYNNLFIS